MIKHTRRNWIKKNIAITTGTGAALGISTGNSHTTGSRKTFQNVNSLDPEGIFAAIMVGLYPDLEPKERRDKLVDHAEWGIREIQRKEKNGTLDFETLGN